MQIKQGIQSDFAVDVEMGQFYEALSTPARLAAFIAEHASPGIGIAVASPQAVSSAQAAAAPLANRGAMPLIAASPVAASAATASSDASRPMPPVSAAAQATSLTDGITHLLEQQLAVMHRQIDLLAGLGATAMPPPVAASRVQAPAAATLSPAVAISPASPSRRRPLLLCRRAWRPRRPLRCDARCCSGDCNADVGDHGCATWRQHGRIKSAPASVPRCADPALHGTHGAFENLCRTGKAGIGDWIATIGFRPELKEMIYPIVSVGSEGSHIRDLDGNDYIDLAMGFGVGFFGHRPPFVVEALRERLDRGFELATQSDLAAENAQLVHELTGCERVVFSNTGTEAIMTAFRLARTVTGRRRIAHFKSAFHGFYDGVLAYHAANGATPMVPGIVQSQVDDVLVLEYGSDKALEQIAAEAGTLAGVLVEPVQSRNPDLQPREFLHALRRLTEQHGIALIFDELVNGFRIHPGGAQAHFGVRADIVTYGKMVGGGMPVSLIAGTARFIDAIDGGPWQFGDASRPASTMTFFGGTFCRHPLSMAATHACLRYMKSEGPALQDRMNQRTSALAERLNALFRQAGAPFRVAWFASQFQVRHAVPGGETFQSLELSVFFFLLMTKGIYTWERRVCFLSIAHTDADFDQIAAAVQDSLHEMRVGGFFGDPSGGAGIAPRSGDAVRTLARPVGPMSPPSGETPPEVVHLTPGQRDLAFRAARGGASSTAYAESLVLDLTGPLDEAALQRALDAVVLRHDALRIRRVDEGTADIARTLLVPIAQQHLADLPDALAADNARGWLAAICRRAFDLDAGPLLRAHLLTLAPDRARFVLVLHHIVADGWSAGVILQELAQCYRAFADHLPMPALPTPTPLAAYNSWYQQRLAERGATTARFWRERLAHTPSLALPTDALRPPRSRGWPPAARAAG